MTVEAPTINTDGVDTFYANNITMRNWEVTCGDDNIALKANSSNILVQDSVFHGGAGVAIGSIGQYPGVYEFIANFTAERVTAIGSTYAGYVKTWTGVEQNFPPNGKLVLPGPRRLWLSIGGHRRRRRARLREKHQ